ncbi:MAG: spore cortex biosynthesis protein YabQ [Clostridia bacterium]|nr:spore cortex biosynthesis protein YabQ [Clostridia bacterium]
MESQIRLDTALMLYSVVLGFGFGVYYEIFRFLRQALPHGTLLVFWEDLFFFLPITGVFLLFLFVFSDGVLRWFTVGGVACGFFLYLGTLGRVMCFFCQRILRVIRRGARALRRLLWDPVCNILKKVTIKLFTKWKKAVIIKRQRRSRQRLQRNFKRLIRSAEKGFR